jgi:hypothetical protein
MILCGIPPGKQVRLSSRSQQRTVSEFQKNWKRLHFARAAKASLHNFSPEPFTNNLSCSKVIYGYEEHIVSLS